MREALNRARQGSGNVVLLAGEPGIGKTRLATELMAEARAAGCFTAIGHCYEMDGTPPFVRFVEIIDYAEVARIAPRLRDGGVGHGGAARRGRGVSRPLGAGNGRGTRR